MAEKKTKINPSIKIVQNLLILQAVNQEFMADLNPLRSDEPFEYTKPLDIDKQKLLSPEESRKALRQYEKNQDIFRKKVAKLRIKYNLSPAYQPFLEDLTEFPAGSTNASFQYPSEYLPEHLRPFPIKNPNNSDEYISVLAINPETKPEEIRRYWKEIKYFAEIYDRNLKTKLPKSYSRLRLKRDLEIYNLRRQGKSAQEIARIINDKNPDEKAIGHQDVNIIIKRLGDEAKNITSHKNISS